MTPMMSGCHLLRLSAAGSEPLGWGQCDGLVGHRFKRCEHQSDVARSINPRFSLTIASTINHIHTWVHAKETRWNRPIHSRYYCEPKIPISNSPEATRRRHPNRRHSLPERRTKPRRLPPAHRPLLRHHADAGDHPDGHQPVSRGSTVEPRASGVISGYPESSGPQALPSIPPWIAGRVHGDELNDCRSFFFTQ